MVHDAGDVGAVSVDFTQAGSIAASTAN